MGSHRTDSPCLGPSRLRRFATTPSARPCAAPRQSGAGLALLALALCGTAGCADRESFLRTGPSTSQLKVSLSHVQFENEQLRTEVARLKEESRSMEDRLVQEQIHNGDLAARLDDARNVLRDRGLDSGTRLGARAGGKALPDPDDASTRPRTLPAGRTTRKPRKPPAASIPGELDLPTAAEDTETQTGTISLLSPTPPSRRAVFPDDSSGFSADDDLRWQPVATAPAAQPVPRR